MLSTVASTASPCFLRSVVRGVDAIDYNTPKPPGYRVITPSQNRNGCFRPAIQHSLLSAASPHACGALHASAPLDGACPCNRIAATSALPSRVQQQQFMLSGTPKTVVSLLPILEIAIM
jgi:hypothetical protein